MARNREDAPWYRDKIFLSAIGLVLSTALLLAGLLAYLRDRVMLDGTRLTGAFAAVIEEQTARSLQAVDLRMERLAQSLGQADPGDVAAAATGVQAMLQEPLDALPFIEHLMVIGTDGLVRHASDPALRGIDLSSRDYFAIYKTRPSTGFFIGTPLVGRNGEWLVPTARPLTNSREQQIGVLVASVRVSHFARLWASLTLEADASVGLLRSDGRMLMRSPIDGSAMGRSFSSSPLFTQHLPVSPTGGYRIVSTIDGHDRYIAYRTLNRQHDLVLIVGRSIDAILAPWYRTVLLLTGVWFVASVGLLLLAIRLARQSASRRQTDDANAEKIERLTVACESAGLVLWDWDMQADEWHVTPTYFTTLGYPPRPGPVTRAVWQTFVHPDDRNIARMQVSHLQSRLDERYDHLIRMRHADGRYRWMRTTGRVQSRDEQGRPIRMVGTRMDVTDRILAEQERMQMVERISDAMVSMSADWRITHVNERAGVLLGYRPAALVGQHVWTMFPDSGGFQFREVYERCMATQQPEVFEEHYAPANVWYESHIYPSPEGLSVYFRDITDRKLDEQALRDAKEQAESLINGANVMVVGLNAQGQITTFNHMAEALTGYTMADLAGRNCFEVLVPRERYPQVHAEFGRIAAGGLPRQFENPILTAKGEERMISWQNSVLRDGDTVTGTLSFGIDVTLRRQVEQQLAESRDQFETLARNSLQGIALIRKAHLVYVNPAYCSIAGRSAAQLSRCSVVQLQQWVHPDDRAASIERHRRAAAGEPISQVSELRILDGQGRWRWVQAATRNIVLSGEPAVLNMLLDTHDRHLAEEALRASEERFRSAFDSSGIGIGLTAMDGYWLQVNPAFCRIVGYTAQELLQRTFMDITHPDDLAPDLALMDDLLAGKTPFMKMEKRYLHRDGHPVWINLTVALVRDADGKPAYTVAQIEDIDLRMKLAHELRESQANLKATVDALPDLMFEVDLDGVIHACHAQRPGLLLRPPAELIGRRVADILPADAADTSMAALRDTLAQGHSTGRQVRLELAHGAEWFELSCSRKDTPAGAPPRFIVLSRLITDRVRALDALRTSEALMRQMAESVSQMFFLFDLQATHLLYVSSAVESVLGCTAEALQADIRAWTNKVHPDDRPMVREVVRQAAVSGAFDFECRIQTGGDTLRWVLARAFPVRDEQGRPYRCAGVVEDITSRKTLELREEQEQAMLAYLASDRPLPDILAQFVCSYEAMVPGMTGSVLLMDPDGQHLRHGAAPHLPADYCAAIDGSAIGPAAGSCGTSAYTGETVIVTDIATDPLWLDYRELAAQFRLRACWSVPIKGLQGQVLGTFAFYFDHVRAPNGFERTAVEHGAQLASQAIERHMTVQALQRSEARYRSVVEWSPMGILVIQRGRIVYCNPATVQIHHATSMQDLLGMDAIDLVHPDERARVADAATQVIRRNAATEPMEVCCLRLDGGTVELQTKVVPTLFDGQPALQVVMFDVTARKQAETALWASRQQLRVLSAKVLAAQETERRRVAHELHDELGQSLTAIKINLQSQALAVDAGSDDSHAENIRIVEHALRHVRQLALALRPSMLDDLGLVPALRWLTEQVSQRQKLQVRLTVSEKVGRLAPDTETAAFRIVQEALTNIERHAGAERVEVRADIDGDDMFVLHIVDNGIGFDVDASRQRANAGASMGVLGMDERATLVGGSLDIRSTPGAGTTVTLRCPLAPATV